VVSNLAWCCVLVIGCAPRAVPRPIDNTAAGPRSERVMPQEPCSGEVLPEIAQRIQARLGEDPWVVREQRCVVARGVDDRERYARYLELVIGTVDDRLEVHGFVVATSGAVVAGNYLFTASAGSSRQVRAELHVGEDFVVYGTDRLAGRDYHNTVILKAGRLVFEPGLDQHTSPRCLDCDL
jgi:hypothetical protein